MIEIYLGQQIGRITLIAQEWRGKPRRLYYLCLCRCNATFWRSRNHIIRTDKPNAFYGCDKCRHDLRHCASITKVTGSITKHGVKIIAFDKFAEESRGGVMRSYYKAKCHCGNIFSLCGAKREQIKSCGCLKDKRGEKASKARFTNEQVISMRELYKQGYSISKLATMFNSPRKLLYNVTKGYTYTDI